MVKVAIVGSGNIGTDLLIKIKRLSKILDVVALVGIDPDSDGLKRAARLGVAAHSGGLESFLSSDDSDGVTLVLDATSAKAHAHHDKLLEARGIRRIDLTPAAIGPFVVPCVNLEQNLSASNVNMVTCGGQATIPVIAAISRVAPVRYAEIVATIASRSAGPGTRANIDEFTETTARAIESVGGAEHGKAIIVLNPAEPPITMRDTVFCLCNDADQEAIRRSVRDMVAEVAEYVPGYRMKHEVQIAPVAHNESLRLADYDMNFTGLSVSVFLEVEGAAHYLPAYAGNLDIMTSAALRTAERMVQAGDAS